MRIWNGDPPGKGSTFSKLSISDLYVDLRRRRLQRKMPAIRASKPKTPPTTPPAIAPVFEERFDASREPVPPTIAVDDAEVVDEEAETSSGCADCEGEELAEPVVEIPVDEDPEALPVWEVDDIDEVAGVEDVDVVGCDKVAPLLVVLD